MDIRSQLRALAVSLSIAAASAIHICAQQPPAGPTARPVVGDGDAEALGGHEDSGLQSDLGEVIPAIVVIVELADGEKDIGMTGLKDLLVAQGHDLDTVELNSSSIHYREPMMLARNTGHGFVDVSAQSGEVFREVRVGRGMAVGDLYNDGPAYILRNQTTNANHWIGLKLVGHRSNRDSIGAEVKLTTAAGSQWETVSTAGSYLSSSDKRLHFGLGSATTACVEILRPSGIRQVQPNQPVH